MIHKILCRFPFINIYPKWDVDEEILKKDFIYLRKPTCINGFFIDFLKKLKKDRPDMKIIMEIPTYPYDKEMIMYIRNWPLYIKEISARNKLKNDLDAIALLTDEKEVFGVRTLKIKNGLDFKGTRARYFNPEKNSIDIAIVAMFYAWHGYERLIEGLYQYYQKGNKRKINLHFVGDGPELVVYKKMVSQCHLEKYIRFYGMRDKKFLEKIYDECDIGASSFGLYKKNLGYSCDLKSREYLSAGLPIICSGKMDIMTYQGLNKYILEFPNDDSTVPMEDIIRFHDDLYLDKTEREVDEMIYHIRKTASEYLSMGQAMKNIFDYIDKA